MRVLLAAIRCGKGDLDGNLAAHEAVLREAGDRGCEIAVFPEMSLTGSVDPRTHPERLVGLDSPAVVTLTAMTLRYGVSAVFGVAERGPFITQAYAGRGQLVGAYRKRHLGDDEEGFLPGSSAALFRLGDAAFGIAICAEAGVDYPFDEPAAAGAEAVFFCAAPGLYGRRTDEAGWRAGFDWWESCGLADARRHARRTGLWVAMTTQAGSTVDEDFPGIAAVVAPSGEVVDRLPDWRAGLLVADLPAVS